MTGANASAVVAVEVLVKQEQVAPMRVLLELLCAAVDGTPTLRIAQEKARQPARQFCRHLPEGHLALRAGRKGYGQALAVKVVKFLQRLDQQVVHGKPDGAAPVRVAAKQPGGGLCWLVIHPMFRAVDRQDIRMRAMKLGERPNAVGRQELALVEHVA